MFEDNPMLSINVRIWKYFSVILNRNWRVYALVAPVCLMNAMQFVYLYRVWGDLWEFTLNTFFAVAILDCTFRTCLVIKNRKKFEDFLCEFHRLYMEIESSDDDYSKNILREITQTARKISIFNLFTAFFDLTSTILIPVFSRNRVHPYGVALPGVDMTKFPIYEIFYIHQLPIPITVNVMCMPFINLFASWAIFGKSLLKILQHRLRNVCKKSPMNEVERFERLIECIKQYNTIERYVANFNSLVTNGIAVEFLVFMAIICLLLFCFNVMNSLLQISIVFMYAVTILFVLFVYYWLANDLITESAKLSAAAYDMEWYECCPRFRKTLLLFTQRCQVPLKLMVGNIYPMSLETFVSLWNASYSYFTLLHGINKN